MRTMESEAVIRDSGPAADAAYDETIRIQDGRLCVALVRADYLVAELNGVHCVITKSALLCLGGCDRLEILYEKRLRVRALSFTPRFINRGLDYATLCSPSYQELQAAFGYPPLDPFFSRSSVYNGILPVEEELDGLLDSYFDVMQRQLRDHPDRNWYCRTRSLLFSVFSAAGQLYRQFGPPVCPDSLIEEMTQYIQMHLDRPMSMEDLCARFHVNKSTLCRRFKASVGLTVFQYILDSRLRRCRSDLAFTELSIGEIAEKYGFADTTHFSKAFKAQFGLAPMAFRQREKTERKGRGRHPDGP